LAASHKQCQSFDVDEVDEDDEDDEDGGMMRMMRMLRMNMRMIIMMSGAAVGLQYLLGPASENPQCSNRLSPGFARNARSKKHALNGSPNLQYAYERCSRQCNICMLMAMVMVMLMMMMMMVMMVVVMMKMVMMMVMMMMIVKNTPAHVHELYSCLYNMLVYFEYMSWYDTFGLQTGPLS